MARGSDTLPPGSDGTPLPPFDETAGDGVLDSGDGVSDTLEEWKERVSFFFFFNFDLISEQMNKTSSRVAYRGVDTVGCGCVLWAEFCKRATCDERKR